jgi:hypothetical protein
MSTGETLTQFRAGLTGEYGLELVRAAPAGVLVTLPVGTGKSLWLQQIAEAAALARDEHDLVITLAPRRDILAELDARLPSAINRVILAPRPRRRCGDLDEPWSAMERNGCAQLARVELCGRCPRRRTCRWPGQLGRLQDVRLVLAAQQHLALNPAFVRHLGRCAGAARSLVLCDESDLLLRPVDRQVSGTDLSRFAAAQRSARPAWPSPQAGTAWLEASELLAAAPTSDLRDGRWKFPPVDDRWAVAVQRAGRSAFGPAFRFLAHEAHSFARSDLVSRERLPDGGIRFALTPDLGDAFMVFSGAVSPDLVRYRLDPDHRRPPLVVPFAGLRVEHPGTRWYNLRSLLGAARYFDGNAGQILDFFAEKIAANIRAGKRTLLVARRRFVPTCASGLRRRLAALGVGPVRIVTGNWGRADFTDPRTLPLIAYGISGVNRFQEFDAAYCLTGYYTTPDAVAATVHDLNPTDDHVPVRLAWDGHSRTRVAVVEDPGVATSILPRLAGWVLDQKEADVVVQAVGRVRPFTQPREVITFHAGRLPGVRCTVEFESLAQARAFFNVKARRVADRDRRQQTAIELRQAGLSMAEIAGRLGVSKSTAKRYCRGSRTLLIKEKSS